MVLTIHIMGYIIAVLIVDYRLGHCKIVNYRLNVNYSLKPVLYSNEVEIQYFVTVLKSFFWISVLYFTTYISVYFYFYFATFCKENGYFYSDTFPLKPSLLVTKSNHL